MHIDEKAQLVEAIMARNDVNLVAATERAADIDRGLNADKQTAIEAAEVFAYYTLPQKVGRFVVKGEGDTGPVLTLVVDHQSFDFAMQFDDDAHLEWYAKQLCIALGRLVQRTINL